MGNRLRIYAFDSYSAPLNLWTNGIDGKWEPKESAATRGDTLYIGTRYNFVHHLPLYVPEAESGSGAMLSFDLTKYPELRGMRLTKISGPFGYLRQRDASLQITRWGTPYCALNTRSPFMNLMDGRPSWWSDPIYGAQMGSYFDTHGGGACDYTLDQGLLTILLVVGIDTYPQHTFETYRGYAEFTIESHTAANPPYIEIEYELSPVKIMGMSPSLGFIDEHVQNRFSWAIVPAVTGAIGGMVQTKAEFQWRVAGRTEVVPASITGEQTWYDLPAGRLPDESIEWRVRAWTDLGPAAEWCEWVLLTTRDSVPLAPQRLSPSGRLVDSTADCLFAWEHVIATGSAQGGYEAEYSIDSKTWVPLIKETTTRQNGNVPKNTLPGGSVFWRVRTYSSDDAPGPWTMASITVQAAPDTPILSAADSAPRLTVQWQAPEQRSFRVRAASETNGSLRETNGSLRETNGSLRETNGSLRETFDSGEVYGTQRRWTIPYYLPDGAAVVELRVSNEYGLYSEWARITVDIRNKPGSPVILRRRETDFGVRLMWEGDDAAYYVYRDGALIARLSGRVYTDDLSAGRHRYRVRAGNEGGFYTLSGEVAAGPRLPCAAICALDSGETARCARCWIPLQARASSPPGHSAGRTRRVTYRKYSGRELPVADVWQSREETLTADFSVRPPDLRALLALTGESVVYKAPLGDNVPPGGPVDGVVVTGVLDDVQYTTVMRGWADVTLSITVTQQEEVGYDG